MSSLESNSNNIASNATFMTIKFPECGSWFTTLRHYLDCVCVCMEQINSQWLNSEDYINLTLFCVDVAITEKAHGAGFMIANNKQLTFQGSL